MADDITQRNILRRLTGNLPPFVLNALISFPLRIAGLVLQLATSIVIARLVGPAVFGAYSYAFVWAALIGITMGLGLGQLGVRDIPKHVENSDGGTLSGYMITLGATMLATTLLTGLVLWALENTGLLVLAPGWVLVTMLAMVQAISLNLTSVLGGFQMILTAQSLENLPRQALFLVMMALAVWLGFTLDSTLLFEMQLWVAVPTYGLTGWILWRAVRRSVPSLGPVRVDLRDWYAAALPMAFAGFATMLNTYVDILMIGALMGDEPTGIYRAASRAAALVMICQMITLRVLGPMLSRALAAGDQGGAQRLLAYGVMLSLSAALVIGGALVGLGETYLGLFGPSFVAGTPSLIILVTSQVLVLSFGAAPMLALLTGREGMVFWINLVGLGANLALNYIMISRFGIEGAAVATAIVLIGINLSIALLVRRTSSLDPTVLSAVRLIRARRRAG